MAEPLIIVIIHALFLFLKDLPLFSEQEIRQTEQSDVLRIVKILRHTVHVILLSPDRSQLIPHLPFAELDDVIVVKSL